MRFLAVIALCLSLMPLTPLAATLIDAQTGFSAERTLVIDGRTYRGKVWAMPGKERHEQAIYGLRPVFLLRADSPLGEIVLTSMKTIVQFDIPAELQMLDLAELKERPIGRETVNGIATTKYALDKSIPQGRAEGTLWLSRDGIPMRLAGTFTNAKGKVSTVRWELSGVKTGSQPAALFESPAGMSKLPPEAIAPLLGLKLKGVDR
ncbi:MAG TPA: hypothetical protein VHG31_08080 [Stellaceae bacterium]|nr:hypothetical protein [Stellaceae bacterium]